MKIEISPRTDVSWKKSILLEETIMERGRKLPLQNPVLDSFHSPEGISRATRYIYTGKFIRSVLTCRGRRTPPCLDSAGQQFRTVVRRDRYGEYNVGRSKRVFRLLYALYPRGYNHSSACKRFPPRPPPPRRLWFACLRSVSIIRLYIAVYKAISRIFNSQFFPYLLY